MSDASGSDFDNSDNSDNSDANDSDDDFEVNANLEDDEDEPVIMSQAQVKARNVQQMLSGSLQVARTTMVSGLKCQNVAAVLARPFKAPFAGASSGTSAELARRLANRRRFVPWGSTANVATSLSGKFTAPFSVANPSDEKKDDPLPPGIEPLVLWEDAPEKNPADCLPSIEVDHMLVKWLRPHQREGVKFMFECVEGLREFDGKGCILADDMGLGKTLQGIALLWTLLKQGTDGKPTVNRALIVCPTSLVSNWDDECNKWLCGRVKTLPVCGDSRADVVSSVNRFLGPRNTAQVMIISYETFRIHVDKFVAKGTDGVQLVMCDEAHRLKNGDTLTNKALCAVPCSRRVMLSGTPMQNHLDEFYAMVGFCNPGLLGSPGEFAKKYERPILAGREPDATDKQLILARERNTELSELVNKFVLRRTNTILSKHLPPKVVEVVCCRLSPLQSQLYQHFLTSKATQAALTGKHTMVLSAITALKKLCNHPKLIYDLVTGVKNTGVGAAGFESCSEFFTPGMYDVGRGAGGRSYGGKASNSGGMVDGWEFHSGKFAVLARLLSILRKETKDRIVIISNYTQTLDLVELLCRQNNYPSVRLDGSTSINKRQKLVKQFNDPTSGCFAFLLSSKAGGCGINLIGGNRLVLFDPDWNPANDKQAAARCWRDGQTKKCYLYRLLATGSIEEKVFQRQLSKESLQNVVSGEGTLEQASMSKEDLRKLFTLDENTHSDTHDNLSKGCLKCPGKHLQNHVNCGDGCPESFESFQGEKTNEIKMKLWEEQADDPHEQNLEDWGHHHRACTVPDPIMRRAAGNDVSFVFSLQVEGCAVVDKKQSKKEDKVDVALVRTPPTATAAPNTGYRLGDGGSGLGLRKPLAVVAPNETTPAAVGAKPPTGVGAGAPRVIARTPARGPPNAAAVPSNANAKPKPKPVPKSKKQKHLHDSESEGGDSESEGDDEAEASESDEASASDSASDSEPVPTETKNKTKTPQPPQKQKTQPRRRPTRAAASKPSLVEVDSSDTDDDEVVYRKVLKASLGDAEKKADADEKSNSNSKSKSDSLGSDSDDDADDAAAAAAADSDAVEDSDVGGDSDSGLEVEPLPFNPVTLGNSGKRPRPRSALVNRASGNGAVGGTLPSAGVEVDAKRGRKSEGNGSVPSSLQGAANLENFHGNGHGLGGLLDSAQGISARGTGAQNKNDSKSNSERKSLSSVSELCTGSPSSEDDSM